MLLCIVITLLCTSSHHNARAETPPKTLLTFTPPPPKKGGKPRLKVELKGRYHGNVNMGLSRDGEESFKTAFETTRLYLTTKATLERRFTFRATLDFAHLDLLTSDGTDLEEQTTPLLGYIKYAYIQYQPQKSLKLRFGQQATPWIGTMDKVMEYRYVYKTGLDYYGLNASAETGLTILGEALQGRINYHIGVFNGNGYTNEYGGESFRNLLFAGRLSLYPFVPSKPAFLAGMGLHFYLHTDAREGEEGTPRERLYGGALSFTHKYVDMLVEVVVFQNGQRSDSAGLLIAPYLKLKYRDFALFATYSRFQDQDQPKTWTRLIFGATYDQSRRLSLSINYQNSAGRGFSPGSNSSGLFLNTKVRF